MNSQAAFTNIGLDRSSARPARAPVGSDLIDQRQALTTLDSKLDTEGPEDALRSLCVQLANGDETLRVTLHTQLGDLLDWAFSGICLEDDYLSSPFALDFKDNPISEEDNYDSDPGGFTDLHTGDARAAIQYALAHKVR